MSSLIFLVEQTATGLYILFGVGVVLALLRWRRAQTAYRSTHFELERDIYSFQRSNAATSLVLLAEALLIVGGLQNIVAPTLRATMADNIVVAAIVLEPDFRTPTPAPLTEGVVIDASGVEFGADDPSDQIIATPTLTPTPVGTIIPNMPAPLGCDTPNAALQIPANGMIVFEPMVVVGTAFTDNFAFFRFELRGESTFNSFVVVGGDRTQPVADLNALGQFVPSYYTPGEYQFRLSVFDISNAVKASCTLTIFISDPILTPTPLGTPSST
ncbi:MAG: hypothetical protein SGI73_08795 [Chloroflexota bacterium]|nr:hypothetical protein [Chloroflexota bacterium]